MQYWQKVRQELGCSPIAEGAVGGAIPLYAERYLLNGQHIGWTSSSRMNPHPAV